MYTSSWIGQYYGYVGSVHDEHVVVFAGRTGKKVNIIENNTRFYVNVLFPDSNVQTYFFPPSTWQRIGPSLQQDLLVFRTDTLSAMNHGMITDGYPYSKSPFYTAPFFLTFKTDHSVVSNFLSFNDFLIPNSYGRFLSYKKEPLFVTFMSNPAFRYNAPLLRTELRFRGRGGT